MKNQLSRPCNLCHGQTFSVLSTRDRDGQYLRTVICQDCGLVWSDPFPMNPTEYYQKDYRILYKGTYQPKLKHVYRAAKVAIERYQQLQPYLKQQQRIIEIGSGGGEFVYLLKQLGFDIQGIEPNEGYAQYAQHEYGLTIQIGCVQGLALANESFDLAVLSHVFEHLDNPTAILQQLHQALANSGLLVIEVPNIEAVCQAPQNTFHIAHLFNFNAETLTLMVKKCGFEILQLNTSKDGGNLHLIAQKSVSVDNSITDLTIHGNCEKIVHIIQQHQLIKHYVSMTPYLRFIRKIIRWMDEYQIRYRFTNPKALLDNCYHSLIKNAI